MSLWVIGLLSLLVSSLAFDSHLEARIVSYYRKRTQAEYLAHSGLELAEMLMSNIEAQKREDPEFTEDNTWYEPVRQLADGLAIRGLEHALGNGTITLDIVPEPGRRNINKLGQNDIEREQNLERILETGGLPEEYWPELIESFLDWTDPDDEPRVDGAETEDYYDKLEPPLGPYQAKNGPLDTVGELLLVKGFDRAILYGGVLSGEGEEVGPGQEEPIAVSGIADLLTTYGDDKINVNAASQRVLMTLPGIDEIVAGAILEEREGWLDEAGEKEDRHFESFADLRNRIPEVDGTLSRYISTSSQIYRITSVGTVQGVRRMIWAIVKYDGQQLTVWRWREHD